MHVRNCLADSLWNRVFSSNLDDGDLSFSGYRLEFQKTLLNLLAISCRYYNSENAKGAIEALKAKMAQTAFALRDGKWVNVLAKDLVPGDVIQANIGMVMPADVCKLELDWSDNLSLVLEF